MAPALLAQPFPAARQPSRRFRPRPEFARFERSFRQPREMEIGEDLVALMRRPGHCFLVITMPDGSPQVTQTWVDTDGGRVLVNCVQGSVKERNVARDPRVAVAIADPDDARYVQIRGRVVERTTEGAVDHIERLARKYLGRPYPWYGGRDQIRVILVIEAESIGGRG